MWDSLKISLKIILSSPEFWGSIIGALIIGGSAFFAYKASLKAIEMERHKALNAEKIKLYAKIFKTLSRIIQIIKIQIQVNILEVKLNNLEEKPSEIRSITLKELTKYIAVPDINYYSSQDNLPTFNTHREVLKKFKMERKSEFNKLQNMTNENLSKVMCYADFDVLDLWPSGFKINLENFEIIKTGFKSLGIFLAALRRDLKLDDDKIYSDKLMNIYFASKDYLESIDEFEKEFKEAIKEDEKYNSPKQNNQNLNPPTLKK